MRKKIQVLVVGIMMALALAACGDTATPAATTSSATSAAAATSAAMTSAAMTSAAMTTAAMTSAPATTTSALTTAAMTSAATAGTAMATTASMTSSTAGSATTTAAMTSSTAMASGTAGAVTTAASSGGATDAYNLQPEPTLPALAANAGGKFTTISLAKLAPTLHPYPSNGDFTQSLLDVQAYIGTPSLLTFDANQLVWELEWAKSLSVSDDKKTFTFTLRDGLKWSDGSPVTTDDYQLAYNGAIVEDKTQPDNNYVGLTDLQKITSFKTDSTAKTITVTLDNVYIPYLALGYANNIFPVPSSVWKDKPFRDATKNPEILKPTVVAGPYQIDSYDPNSQGVLKPNPNWYRGKPSFDQIVLKGGDASIVVQAIKTGQADWSYNIPSAQYAQAKADPTLNVVDWSAIDGSFRYVEYNTKHTPMDDKAFRQALNYAIDRDNLIKLAEAGHGVPELSFVNPQNPFYNKNVNPYTYSLDTAKKTLADAGYKLDGSGNLLGKDGKPISLKVITTSSSKPRVAIATYMQQQFKQLGITVTPDIKEFAAYTKQLAAHDFDISLSTVSGSYDPDSFKDSVISTGTQNNSQYSNPQIDTLFKQGQQEFDNTKRTAIYSQAQQIISDDSPVFFLWNITDFSLFNKKVQGVTPQKLDGNAPLQLNDASTRWYLAQ